MKTVAIYHKDCIDGTTAGAVILRKYPDALLFPMSHGYSPEEIEPVLQAASAGDRILTVDCVMGVKELLAAGHAVISIDHHIGAKEEYTKLAQDDPKFTFIFDNDKSGASLSWSYLFPDEKMPEVIKYVEDRDLWKNQYGEKTKNLGYSLFMLVNKPEEMTRFFNSSLDQAERDGEVINKFMTMAIDHAVKTIEPVMLKIGQHKVPLYNINVNKSESGNILVHERNQAVGLFTVDGDSVKISFRSLEEHTPSALELAQLVGGGGHKRAAGAKMKLSDFFNSIVS